MKLIKLMAAVLVLSMLTAQSNAEQTGYEVELIIYEDATKRYIDSENWSYNDMLNQTNDAVFNTESVEPDAQFNELDWEGAVLSNALQKIQDSPGLNVLLSKRWRQTGLDRDKAYPVEIDVRTPGISGGAVAAAAAENKGNLQQFNIEPTTAGDFTQPITTINGYVRLVMSRYLHFEVNLNYTRALQSNEYEDLNNNVFPVVAERRMRSREIHYIDHPLVGIIVHATPYTIGKKSQ